MGQRDVAGASLEAPDPRSHSGAGDACAGVPRVHRPQHRSCSYSGNFRALSSLACPPQQLAALRSVRTVSTQVVICGARALLYAGVEAGLYPCGRTIPSFLVDNAHRCRSIPSFVSVFFAATVQQLAHFPFRCRSCQRSAATGRRAGGSTASVPMGPWRRHAPHSINPRWRFPGVHRPPDSLSLTRQPNLAFEAVRSSSSGSRVRSPVAEPAHKTPSLNSRGGGLTAGGHSDVGAGLRAPQPRQAHSLLQSSGG